MNDFVCLGIYSQKRIPREECSDIMTYLYKNWQGIDPKSGKLLKWGISAADGGDKEKDASIPETHGIVTLCFVA